MPTEQIDHFERQTRLKELQLAYLRGDITLAEHDRRRARYEPGSGTVATVRALAPREARRRWRCLLFGHKFARTDVKSDGEFTYYNLRCTRCGAKG